nr:pre-mRNA splicing Prp18-interacting factor [Tanacetum cinerariifolium]
MLSFVLCVGCGEPLYGFSPCRRCTCERCGIDLPDGICPLCNSMNSCTYDPNPNSFDCPLDSYHPPHPTYETYSGDSCGNDPQFGYDCPPQFPLNYEPEPGYSQNYNSYPHDSPSFPQQYPCCDGCGVTHEPYQCQPENHDYYDEQNFCYDYNSFGFDQIQTLQYTVNHPIFNAHNDFLNSQNELFTSQNKIMEQMTQLTSICEMTCQIVQKKLEEKQIEEEQAAKAQNRKLPVCYDDDDDKEESNSLKDNIISELPPCSAVTPSEPIDSLSMGDEHLDTIPATESDEVIKSCVENLVPNPKSILNHDSSIISSSLKIDSLLDEFAGELTLLKSIPPGVDKTDCHPKNEIRLSQRLLYDNSSPRPPEEFNSENSNAEIESFSPSHIPNKDRDILFLEILLHDDHIPLPDTLDFSYEVRIFLPFFNYPVTSPVLLSSGSEDKIFDPGITVNHFYSFQP